jgi:hypothetical protein
MEDPGRKHSTLKPKPAGVTGTGRSALRRARFAKKALPAVGG